MAGLRSEKSPFGTVSQFFPNCQSDLPNSSFSVTASSSAGTRILIVIDPSQSRGVHELGKCCGLNPHDPIVNRPG